MVEDIETMTGKAKILEEIHPLHIIREVEKWPALYAKDSPESASPYFRQRIWAQVGRELFAQWDDYSKLERQAKISDLMKKWRNLRDTFKRQVEVEKKIKEGHKIKKKVYVYYKHMSFLLPHVQSDSELEDASARPRPPPARRRPPSRPARPAQDRDIDEDRHFLLSLVPSFRRMSEDQKLVAKVEILQVIKRVRRAPAAAYEAQLVLKAEPPDPDDDDLLARALEPDLGGDSD